MNNQKSLLFLFVILLTGNISFAHSEIKGKVVDKKSGVPLPGASVMVKGTSYGTTTDAVENFILKSDSAIHALVISYVGYKTEEVKITHPSEFIVIDWSRYLLRSER